VVVEKSDLCYSTFITLDDYAMKQMLQEDRNKRFNIEYNHSSIFAMTWTVALQPVA